MIEMYLHGLQCRKRRGIQDIAHKIDPNGMKKVKSLGVWKEKLSFGISFVIYKHLNVLYRNYALQNSIEITTWVRSLH